MGIGDWKHDSMENQITNLGKLGRDKRLATNPVYPLTRGEDELAALFDGDSLARKMVLKPVQAELRNWIDFTGLEADQHDRVVTYLSERKVRDKVREARIWEQVFGGAGLFLGVDDGNLGQPDIPVNEAAIRSIAYMEPIDRFKLDILERDSDPRSDRFGKPLYYHIRPNDQTGRAVLKVHASRMIQFPGGITTQYTRRQRQGWGMSAYEVAYERLSDVNDSFSAMAVLLQSFAQTVFRMKGLVDAIRAGQNDYIKQRISIIDEARSVVNAIILDADHEEFEVKSTSVAGMAELIDRVMMVASYATDIPVTILFGRSPAGQNATGESDMAQWYERINDQQEEQLRPPLEQLLRYIFLAQDGPTAGIEPDQWEFKFRPIDRPDESTQAKTHLTQAQADQVYVTTGVLSPEEVRDSRFGADEFSTHTALQEGLNPLEQELEALRAVQNEQRSSPDPDREPGESDQVPDRDRDSE